MDRNNDIDEIDNIDKTDKIYNIEVDDYQYRPKLTESTESTEIHLI